MKNKYYLNFIKSIKENPLKLNTQFKNKFINFDEKNIKNIEKVANDMLNRKSKLFRYFYINNYGNFLNIKNENFLKKCGEMIEILHNATLIIDDIEDNSVYRRNELCSHLKFGNGLSINTGVFMMFDIINVINKEKSLNNEQKLKIYEIYHDCIQKLLVGLNSDISWAEGNYNEIEFISEKDYLEMIEYKTSQIIIMFIEILNIFEDKNFDYIKEYTRKFGILFQINDDYINLTSDSYSKTKGVFAEDITEGKITLICIHAFNNLNIKDRIRLIQILKMKTKDIKLKLEFIDLLKKSNSLNYIKNYIDHNVNEINNNLNKFYPNNIYISNKIDLLNYLIKIHN